MKYLFVTASFFASVILLNACAEEGGSSSPSRVKEKPSYGEQGIANTWPGDSDGVEISETPMAKNYYVVVDGSGSMLEVGCSTGGTKIDVAKSSISRFIDKIPASDNIGLYVFGAQGMGEQVPLGAGQHGTVKSAIKQIQAGGGTPLGSAVNAGRQALSRQGKRQLGYGEYHLVIVTDGAASDRQHLNSEMNTLLESTPINVHTIGFCIDSRHTLNQPGYVIYKAADNPKMLEEGLEMVLAEAESFDVSAFEGN